MDRWRAVVKVFESPATAIDRFLNDGVTTCFPADCVCCGGPLERAGTVPVCEGCLARVVRDTVIGCYRCGDSMDAQLDMEDERFARNLAESLLCRACRLAPPDFERAVSFARYDSELRDLLHLLKFTQIRAVAPLLGSRLAEAILTLEGVAGPELLVVAVPLFRKRERQRGFNQSVLLADAALEHLRRLRPGWRLEPAHGLLKRRRNTESSFVLSKRGRRRNLAGAIQATDRIAGREVLLIDDILTSGATARECAHVLMRAGADKVWVATLARARRRSTRYQHEDPEESVAIWDLPATATAGDNQPTITINEG